MAQEILRDYENPSKWLIEYAKNPSANKESLGRLVGLKEPKLLEILKTQLKNNYDLVLKITVARRSRYSYVAAVQQGQYNIDYMVTIDVDEKSKQVVNVYPDKLFLVLLDNAPDGSVAWTMSHEIFGFTKRPGETWGLNWVDRHSPYEVILGEVRQYPFLSFDEFKEKHPKLFERALAELVVFSPRWEAYKRLKTFDVARLRGANLDRIPLGLRETFIQLINSAVKRDFQAAKAILAPSIDERVLGKIGAVAITDNFRIANVTQQQAGPDLPTTAHIVTQDHSELGLSGKAPIAVTRGKAAFTFTRANSANGWMLSSFEERTVTYD
jgi:hypothetical protein